MTDAPTAPTRYACHDCGSITPAPHLGDCRSCSWTVGLRTTEVASFRISEEVMITVVEHDPRPRERLLVPRYTIEKPGADDGFGRPTVEILSTESTSYAPAIFTTAVEAMDFALRVAGWAHAGMTATSPLSV